MIFILILLFFLNLNSLEKPILMISIPKCGTHLLYKCIKTILNIPIYPRDDDEKNNFFANHDRFCCENMEKHRLLKNASKFLIYRDPRDQLISFIFWLNRFNKDKIHNNFSLEEILDFEKNLDINLSYDAYKHLNFDELILQLILGGSAYYDVTGIYKPNYKTHGITDFYKSYWGWLSHFPDFVLIKFEDLIGSKGGGSDETQINTVKKIANNLGKKLTDNEIKIIADNLFGATWTFREGQIGCWKKYFKPIHKDCFKIVAGQLLIELGYEKDLNW